MRPLEEILSLLSASRTPADVAESLRRLLRLPALWEALREPGVVERCLQADTGPLTPGTCLLVACGYSQFGDLQALPGAGPGSDPAAADTHEPSSLRDVILLAARLLSPESSAETLAAEMATHPDAWREALACVWPHLQDSPSWLRGLIHQGEPGLLLASFALALNDPLEVAARKLAESLESSERPSAAAWLEQAGDLPLAISLASLTDPIAGDGGFEASIQGSQLARLKGQPEAALEAAQEAWDAAQRKVAESADALAAAADSDGDALTAVEARRQAVRAFSTPERRALLAVALASKGELDAASEILSAAFDDPMDHLALGIVSALRGDSARASDELSRGWDEARQPGRLPPAFARALQTAAQGSGKEELALEISAVLAETDPTNPTLRRDHAERLLDAGQSAAAVDEARLAFALEPESKDGRRLLARALRSAGRPSEALTVLGAEAGADAKSMAEAATYALEAGQADQALAWSLRLLDVAPSSSAKTLHARALALGGASAEALRELETLIETAPEDEQAWLGAADVLRHNGDTPRAAEMLSRGIQSVPESPSLLMALAQTYADQSRWTEAEPLMRKACAFAEAPAGWHYDHAVVLDQLGRRDESAGAYERCATRQPGHWPARIALSTGLEAKGRFDEALRWLEGLPAGAPSHAHFAAGRLLLRQGTDAGGARAAAGHLLRARSLGETGPELSWWLGQAHEAGNEFNRAVEAYGQAADGAEAGTELRNRAWKAKGRMALAAGEPAAAVAAFEQVRAATPDDAEARLWLSRACQAAGLDAQALEEARAAAEMDPNSAETATQWAVSARQSGEVEEAIVASKRLAQLTPTHADVWLDLGDLLDRSGNRDEAREAAARAVAAAHKDPVVLRKTADLLAKLDDVPAAERLLETAVRLHPDDPDGWTSLAEFEESCGRLDAARDAWLRAAELRAGDAEPLRRAAKVLAKAARPDEAVSLLRDVVAAHPADLPARLDWAGLELERGDRQAALEILHQVPEDSVASPDSRGRLGLLLSRAGDVEAGLSHTRTAVEANPVTAELWAANAEAALRAGLPAEALPALDRAVRLPGGSRTAFALLVPAHLARGDAASAWDGLRAASSEAPSSMDEARSLADAHMRLGEWVAALNTVEAYVESTGGAASVNVGEVLLRLADAQWLFGEIGGAIRHAPSIAREDLLARTRGVLDSLPSEPQTPRQRLVSARWTAWSSADDAAIQALVAACEAAGQPPAATESLAIALLRAGRPVEAFQVVQKIPASALEGVWRALLGGLCHRSLANVERARQAFEAAASDPSIMPLARALSAMPGESATASSQVIAALNDAVAAWPNEPAWHLQLANLYLEREDLDSALPHLQHAVDLDPDNSDAWLALARALREAGHPDDAQHAYEQVLRLLPGLGQVWKEAGSLALSRSDYERAAAWFARAQTLSPSDIDALTGEARADLGLGRTDEARRKARLALDANPDSPAALQCLAEVLALEGEVDQALAMLDRAAIRPESRADVSALRARLLVEHGRADQAVEELKLALEESGEETLWAALADSLASIGRFDEALQAGGEAARLAPRNASHRIRLARVSRQAGHLDRAIDELAQAEALAPSAELAMERGQVYEERREFDRALEAYQHAVELNPSLAQAYLRAGLVYRSLKAYPQAARMFKRAVELAPEDASALHQLAAVHALQLVHGGFQSSAVTT